jgi:hypothetical protein
MFLDLSPLLLLFKTKKGGRDFCFVSVAYGRFLSISIIAAPIMTITVITNTIPNSTVPVDAIKNGKNEVMASKCIKKGEEVILL